MPEAFETQVKLKFVVPTGEVDRVKKIVEAAMSTSFTKKLGGAGAMFGGLPIGKMAMAGGIAGALVVSSPQLQNTLNILIKTVGLILRPLGDIIAVGLRPIIDILRPIGMFFRILIKPYIDAAKQAMKLGRQFMAKGEYGLAAESYALGAGFLLKPFLDQMITAATITIQGILAGIKFLGMGLLAVFAPWSDASVKFGEGMDRMILDVGLAGAGIITETSVLMYGWLAELQKGYDLIKNQANVNMNTTAGYAGEGFVRIIQAATHFFVTSTVVESQIDSMFDSVVEYGRKKVEELNALLNVRPSVPVTYGTIAAYYATERERVAAMSAAERAVAATQGGVTGYWADYYSKQVEAAKIYLQTGKIQNPFNPEQWLGDFVWRAGSKPVRISPGDTLVGSKEGMTKSISIGDIIIRVDKVTSDVDMKRLAVEVRDEVINALRTMT